MNRTHNTVSSGIAARLGRWSSEHRAKAILAWIALLLVALAAAGVGAKTLSPSGESTGEAAKAERLLEHGGFRQPAAEEVLIQVRGEGTINSAGGRRVAREVVAAVSATRLVENVRNPFSQGNGGQLSHDGRSALVLFSMKGKADTADKRVQPVVAAVKRLAEANPQLRIEEFGQASAGKALNETVGKDFKRAEGISIPLTFGGGASRPVRR